MGAFLHLGSKRACFLVVAGSVQICVGQDVEMTLVFSVWYAGSHTHSIFQCANLC